MRVQRRVWGCFGGFFLSFFALSTNQSLAQGRSKKPKILRAIPVEEGTARFDNSVIGSAPVVESNITLPDFGQAQDNYGIPTKSNAEYFRVPESVREERDAARRASLKKAQITLYRFIKEQRQKQFKENDHAHWEKIILEEEAFLEDIFFQTNTQRQEGLLHKRYKENPALKAAIGYMGILRIHGVHGKLRSLQEHKVLRAQPVDVPPVIEAPVATSLFLPEEAPKDILEAQKIERGFHAFETKYPSGFPNPYFSYVRNFSVDEETFLFTPDLSEKVDEDLRRIGLDLLWDLRDEIFSNAQRMNKRFEEMRRQYAPYSRIYLDVFKQNAMAPNSPEFLVLWRAPGEAIKSRRELLGMGLISTGTRTDPRWSPVGAKDESGNTPDGVYRLFGFNKHFKSTGDDDMRGLVMLSYGNAKSFSGRGFHHVFFHSPWGKKASHGCIRVYTGAQEMGVANLIWAAVNPMQLDRVDHTDFGNTGDNNRFIETQSIREIVRYMRENVWISSFSAYEDGYSFTSDATYSRLIRAQYANHEAYSNVSVLAAANELLRKEQTVVSSTSTHRGRYWVYDANIREKLFEINLRK